MALIVESITASGVPVLSIQNNATTVLEAFPIATGGAKVVLKTANAGTAYTITNGTTDRTYDADTVAVAELADIVYTLVQDLKVTGLIA